MSYADDADRVTGVYRRPRRRPFSATVGEPTEWVGRYRVTAAMVTDPDLLGTAKRLLSARLDRYCADLGMVVDTVNWTSWPSNGEPLGEATVDIELVATVLPRTDGVWGEVRAALVQDEDDRETARRAAQWYRPVTPPPTDGS